VRLARGEASITTLAKVIRERDAEIERRTLRETEPDGARLLERSRGPACHKCQLLTELFRDHVLVGKCGDGPDFSTPCDPR
jgi:hypothetical protein